MHKHKNYHKKSGEIQKADGISGDKYES